jgi:hypothetical protein
MDIDYFINKLEEQTTKVDKGDTEVWLKTTYSFIEEYFGSTSSRARSFQSLINDFTSQKIWGIGEHAMIDFKNKALEYIEEMLTYSKELKLRQRKEEFQKASESPIIKSQKVINENTNRKIEVQTIIKTQFPFGMTGTAFGGIFFTVISGAFVLGLYFGGSKFDKEKNEYYEDAKVLKADTLNLHKTLRGKDSLLNNKEFIIATKNDSLKELKQDLNNLYLVLGNYQKKK